MPSYVHAAVTVVVACFIVSAVLPAPRMSAARAGLLCFWLMAAGGATFAVAVSMLVTAMVTEVPAYLVVAPAMTVLAGALTAWLAMFWVANAPAPAVQAEGEDGEDGGGGGGGGLGPEDDPPRDPGPPDDGIPWDAFDREREAWETSREPVPALALVSV